MTDYPKSSGITHIRRLLKKSLKDNRIKHISLTLEQAQDLMDEQKIDNKKLELNLKCNSLKASALLLCIEPKELLERLNNPKPSKLMNDLAEARNKIHYLEKVGDEIIYALPLKEQEQVLDKWIMAKKLYR
jgi:hypothetical protein